MRPQLLVQTLQSLANNAADFNNHHLTLVIDGHEHWMAGHRIDKELPGHVLINTSENVGASRARNIGASSIPKYRRHEAVCFFDDDIYAVPGWDGLLMELAEAQPDSILSGHAHPYNGSEPADAMTPHGTVTFHVPLVISSVNMVMPWSLWDDVGFFTEPGGVGGSEDYDYCMRAKAKGYGFAVTDPECVLHSGIWSSNGNAIVGQSDVAANNQKLLDLYGLNGQVVFG